MATYPAAQDRIQPGRTGKGTNFYFSDEDRERIRVIGAWLMNQGMKVSESLVLKASLRLVRKDASLLNAAREVQMQDRRFKVHAIRRKK